MATPTTTQHALTETRPASQWRWQDHLNNRRPPSSVYSPTSSTNVLFASPFPRKKSVPLDCDRTQSILQSQSNLATSLIPSLQPEPASSPPPWPSPLIKPESILQMPSAREPQPERYGGKPSAQMAVLEQAGSGRYPGRTGLAGIPPSAAAVSAGMLPSFSSKYGQRQPGPAPRTPPPPPVPNARHHHPRPPAHPLAQPQIQHPPHPHPPQVHRPPQLPPHQLPPHPPAHYPPQPPVHYPGPNGYPHYPPSNQMMMPPGTGHERMYGRYRPQVPVTSLPSPPLSDAAPSPVKSASPEPGAGRRHLRVPKLDPRPDSLLMAVQLLVDSPIDSIQSSPVRDTSPAQHRSSPAPAPVPVGLTAPAPASIPALAPASTSAPARHVPPPLSPESQLNALRNKKRDMFGSPGSGPTRPRPKLKPIAIKTPPGQTLGPTNVAPAMSSSPVPIEMPVPTPVQVSKPKITSSTGGRSARPLKSAIRTVKVVSPPVSTPVLTTEARMRAVRNEPAHKPSPRPPVPALPPQPSIVSGDSIVLFSIELLWKIVRATCLYITLIWCWLDETLVIGTDPHSQSPSGTTSNPESNSGRPAANPDGNRQTPTPPGPPDKPTGSDQAHCGSTPQPSDEQRARARLVLFILFSLSAWKMVDLLKAIVVALGSSAWRAEGLSR